MNNLGDTAYKPELNAKLNSDAVAAVVTGKAIPISRLHDLRRRGDKNANSFATFPDIAKTRFCLHGGLFLFMQIGRLQL